MLGLTSTCVWGGESHTGLELAVEARLAGQHMSGILPFPNPGAF